MSEQIFNRDIRKVTKIADNGDGTFSPTVQVTNGEGNPVKIQLTGSDGKSYSAVENDQGELVLKTVDAAPFAYNEEDDYYKVKIEDSFSRIKEIRELGVSVESESDYRVTKEDIDVRAYSYFAVAIRTDGNADFDIKVSPVMGDNTQGGTLTADDINIKDIYGEDIYLFNNVPSRLVTKPLEITFPFLRLAIHNNSADAIDFDVVVRLIP